MSTWLEAWDGAEERIFGYLLGLTSCDRDVNAFLGELPKDFVYSAEGFWMFAMGGGGAPLDYEINMNTPGGCGERQMNATFEGIYNDRTTAKRIAGILMENFPIAESTLTGVSRMKPSEEPTVARDVILRRADQAQGGEMRIWRVSQPFEIIYTKTEA